MGKKRNKSRIPKADDTPILDRDGFVNFKSAGDYKDQTTEGLKRRKLKELEAYDCFINESESDDVLMVCDLPHRDFKNSKKWGCSMAMLKKMGWKEGEGLGKSKNGVLNPIVPDTRYNTKLGLGTPLQLRLNPGKASSYDPNHKWNHDMNQKNQYVPTYDKNALPSYLRSTKKVINKYDGNIPYEDRVEIQDRFKMNLMDLNLERNTDEFSCKLNEIQLKNITEEIEKCGNRTRDGIANVNPENLLRIGQQIHKIAKEEALQNLQLYKVECSRLWRYIDRQVGQENMYLKFYDLVLQQHHTENKKRYLSNKKNKEIDEEPVVNTVDDVLDLSDDETLELFGQKSDSIIRSPATANTEAIIVID